MSLFSGLQVKQSVTYSNQEIDNADASMNQLALLDTKTWYS